MKKIFWIAGLCMLVHLGAYSQDENNDDVYYNGDDQTNYDQDNSQQQNNGDVTYQTFYDQLSPYGHWVNTPEYGTVWVPNDESGFTPYLTGGHWVYTDYGWTWVSDYDWGWGPFHYGRWFQDDMYGWAWVPGYDWAPAWVVWGDYDNYYCWAPVGPGEVITANYRPNARYWNFISHDHITQAQPAKFAIRPEGVFRGGNVKDINSHVNVISHANTYKQSVFFAGPKPKEVEKFTGGHIEKMQVQTVNKPSATRVNNNQISIYRPNIARNTHQPTPANVRNAPQVQQPNQPIQNNRPAASQPDRPMQQQRPAQNEGRQSWTPPRQNVQPQQPQVQPRQQYNPPPVNRGNFIPQNRPEPMQQPHFQQPAPQQHFSQPAPQQHFSQPSPQPMRPGGRH